MNTVGKIEQLTRGTLGALPPSSNSEKTSEPQIKYLGDVQRLELKPGDRFVLTVGGKVSVGTHMRIQEVWRDFVGGDADSFKLLILEDGYKLGVISTEAA